MLVTANPINHIIGNVSLRKVHFLGQGMDERAKIQRHLNFVCDYLSESTPQDLKQSQRQNRAQVLNVLREYVHQGEFPLHDQLPPTLRTPRFIDHRGVHCAVGYLIRQTADSALTEQINSEFEYALIQEIDNDVLPDWASTHGLSLLDCAMIQPMYLPPISDLCPIMMLARDTSLQTKLDIVRKFRDTQLRTSVSGRWIVKYYYKTGPVVVSFMQAQKWSQVPARKLLAMLIDTLEACP